MAEGSSTKDPFFMYIYDLPYQERRRLCGILDIHNKWEELGGIYMKYDVETLNRIGQAVLRGQSPANDLLTLWQTQNHTVLELFVLLSSMKHYQAMRAIKDLVNPKYHRLLYEGEGFLGGRTFNENNNMPPSAPAASGSSSASSKTEAAAPQDEKPMEYGVNLMKDASDNKFSKVLKDSFCVPDAIREESKVDNNSPSKLQGLQGATASVNNNSYYAGAAAAAANTGGAAAALRPSPASPMKELNSALKESNITTRRKSPDASSLSSSVEACTPQINYQELEAATNNWDKSQILGKGGFGTVYRGTWKNTQVAIKRLTLQKDTLAEELVETQRQQSWKELKYLSSFRHDNILPLYGYSAGGPAPCLVYQFLPNGSLDDRLRCRNQTKPLVWAQRLNIAIGTARGLHYLHTVSDKPLIHGDIKSANILLDQNFEPKIGDFGLAREGPMQQYTHMKVSKVYGTRPYLPYEFLKNRKFSVKVDTYSFGVVLFEIATGLRAYDDNRQSNKYLYEYVTEHDDDALHKLVDARADADTSHTATGLMQLGKNCVEDQPRARPDMATVLHKLNMLSEARKKMHKANIMARHNSLQPTTPIELQIAHDHSQQRRLSAPNPPMMRQQQTPSLHLAQPQPVLTNNQQTLSPQISVTPPSNINSAVSTNAAAAISINRATSDAAASSINRAASGATSSSINRTTYDAAASSINRAASDAAASSINRAASGATSSSINRATSDASSVDRGTSDFAASSINKATSDAAASVDASSINRTASPITANSNINNNSTINSNYLPRVLSSFQEENHNSQTTASTSPCDDIPLLSALGMK